MSDLISRKDVIEEYIVSFGLTIEDIERIPAVDAEPVNHGKWVTKIRHEHYPSGKEYEADYCSACGKRGQMDFAYCPNCGAKMDLVKYL